MCAMRIALALAFVIWGAGERSALAAAQQQTFRQQAPHACDDDSWASICRLQAGEDVRVETEDGSSSRGRFLTADPESLTLVVSGRHQRISRADVRQVSVARGTHRKRNTWIGLAIGAGTADLAVRLHCGWGPSACLEGAWPDFYLFAGAGALAGALSPASTAWEEVYIRKAERQIAQTLAR